jgi:D-ribose pyranase
MTEIGILNRDIAESISKMGHMDEMIVCDAGFPIPDGVKTIDISLSENIPTVDDFLKILKKYFSVEKLVLAEETKKVSPSKFKKICGIFDKAEVEIIPHTELKKRSRNVKAIVRTGDFTAFTNVLIVSGPGDRWFVEVK